jgi:hypothetical protein
MFARATRNAKFQPRKLEEYEEVAGELDRVEKQADTIFVTLLHRQTFAVYNLTDELLEHLLKSVGRHVTLLHIDGTCRFRVIGHGA